MGSRRVAADGIFTDEQDWLDPGEGQEPSGAPINRRSWSGEKGLRSGSESLVSAA